MPSKTQLKEGDYVDKEHNLLFIREAGKTASGVRKVGVYDIEYDEYFEAILNDLRRGHTKHSKQTSYKIRSKKQTKWYPGEIRDIYGQPILFLKEIEPHYYIEKNSGHNHRIRRGRFQNLNTLIIFEADIASVTSGSSSGSKKSFGERKIATVLDSLDIDFIEQHVFLDCRSNKNRVLYFDFFLPDYNCCIEFDGEQHEKGWKKDLSTLSDIQERDKIKDNYCKNNNIYLIRISYKDQNKISEQYILDRLSMEVK